MHLNCTPLDQVSRLILKIVFNQSFCKYVLRNSESFSLTAISILNGWTARAPPRHVTYPSAVLIMPAWSNIKVSYLPTFIGITVSLLSANWIRFTPHKQFVYQKTGLNHKPILLFTTRYVVGPLISTTCMTYLQ